MTNTKAPGARPGEVGIANKFPLSLASPPFNEVGGICQGGPGRERLEPGGRSNSFSGASNFVYVSTPAWVLKSPSPFGKERGGPDKRSWCMHVSHMYPPTHIYIYLVVCVYGFHKAHGEPQNVKGMADWRRKYCHTSSLQL